MRTDSLSRLDGRGLGCGITSDVRHLGRTYLFNHVSRSQRIMPVGSGVKPCT
jgi:hypothetical protein